MLNILKTESFRKKKFCLLCCTLLVCLAYALGLTPIAQAALENKTVRIGVYELEGFHGFNNAGDCVGYDVDYLNHISNYTGWNYDYVRANSWSEAINMLRRGEIDLLSPSQIIASRLDEFKFSAFPIGKVYGAILANYSSKVIYEDFTAFNRMTFGIEQGNTYAKLFEDYAKRNGFTPHIQYYPNHEELVQALRSGKVDAIVANVMRAEKNMRLLGKAGTALFYYMYRKNDVQLGSALDDALDKVEIDEPNFQQELVASYYPIYNEEPFSKRELEFVKTLPVIRVACPGDARPYFFKDDATGELTGIGAEYIRTAGERVGIKYELIPVQGEVTKALIKEHNINLLVESGIAPIEKSIRNGMYSNNILNGQQLIVIRDGVDYSIDKPLTIAWYGMNNIANRNMKDGFPKFKWIACATAEEAMESVREGMADGCMINQFAANWFLAMPKFENLKMVSNSSLPQSLCLRTGEDIVEDPSLLINIINKSFKQINPIETQQIVIKYTTAMPYKLTFLEACYKYRYVVMLISVLVLLIIYYLFRSARDSSSKAARDQMTGLYNRTAGKSLITKQIKLGEYKGGALLLIDLDHFKEVNDTLGHQAGDSLLVETAGILLDSSRAGDIVCRLGGDEFLIYYGFNVPGTFLEERLENLRSKLERTVKEGEKAVKVSASIGVAQVPQDGYTYDHLYKCADKALYKVKEGGRNGFAFYEKA